MGRNGVKLSCTVEKRLIFHGFWKASAYPHEICFFMEPLKNVCFIMFFCVWFWKKLKLPIGVKKWNYTFLFFCFFVLRDVKVRKKRKRGRGKKEEEGGVKPGVRGLAPRQKLVFLSLSRARWGPGILFSGPAQWDLSLGKFSARSESFWEQK